MKVRNLLGERLKDVSDESGVKSQILMTKGGYMNPVGSGIFVLYAHSAYFSQNTENTQRRNGCD